MTVSRSLLIGLIVSAALNVFLVGGVVGVLLVRQTPAAPPPAPAAAPSMDRVTPPPTRPGSPPPPRSAVTAALPPGEGPGRPPLWSAGQGLSQDSRQTLRRTLREANQRNQPIIRQARAERQAALQALKTMPYDPAVVSQHLAEARTLDGQARTNVEAALANFATSLSVEERAALAEGLQRVYAPRARAASAR